MPSTSGFGGIIFSIPPLGTLLKQIQEEKYEIGEDSGEKEKKEEKLNIDNKTPAVAEVDKNNPPKVEDKTEAGDLPKQKEIKVSGAPKLESDKVKYTKLSNFVPVEYKRGECEAPKLTGEEIDEEDLTEWEEGEEEVDEKVSKMHIAEAGLKPKGYGAPGERKGTNKPARAAEKKRQRRQGKDQAKVDEAGRGYTVKQVGDKWKVLNSSGAPAGEYSSQGEAESAKQRMNRSLSGDYGDKYARPSTKEAGGAVSKQPYDSKTQPISHSALRGKWDAEKKKPLNPKFQTPHEKEKGWGPQGDTTSAYKAGYNVTKEKNRKESGDVPEWPERKSTDGGLGSVTRIPPHKRAEYEKDVMQRGNAAARRLAGGKYSRKSPEKEATDSGFKSGTKYTFDPNNPDAPPTVSNIEKSKIDRERERLQQKYGTGYDPVAAHKAQQKDKTRPSVTGGKTFRNRRP